MSYIDDVTNKTYTYVLQRFVEEKKMAKSVNGGGALRRFSGETVENLVHMIWVELAKVHTKSSSSIDIVDLKGDDVQLTITDDNGDSIDESVDRHCFINGKLSVAVECKTVIWHMQLPT